MTQINADELKKFVKLSGIPSSSSASSAVEPLRSVLGSRRLLFIRRWNLLLSPHSDAIGFVWGKPLARRIAAFRNSRHPNWYWLRRGGTRFGRDLAGFLDPSPDHAMGSFGNSVVGFVGGERNWLRSGKRCVRSGASRRSVRIVKERRTRRLQLPHRGRRERVRESVKNGFNKMGFSGLNRPGDRKSESHCTSSNTRSHGPPWEMPSWPLCGPAAGRPGRRRASKTAFPRRTVGTREHLTSPCLPFPDSS